MRFILVKVHSDEATKQRLAWAFELGFAQYRATCGEIDVDAWLWAQTTTAAKLQVREWYPEATFSDERAPEPVSDEQIWRMLDAWFVLVGRSPGRTPEIRQRDFDAMKRSVLAFEREMKSK